MTHHQYFKNYLKLEISQVMVAYPFNVILKDSFKRPNQELLGYLGECILNCYLYMDKNSATVKHKTKNVADIQFYKD